jgi:hypothetical protein
MNNKRAPLLACMLIPAGLFAQSPDVDWHFFGGTKIHGKAVDQFYDGKSLVKRPGGHIEVWTKGLPQSQIDARRLDKASTDRIAGKMITGYMPPIALVVDLNQDQQSQILIEEDIANGAQIQPTMRMLGELDCAGHLVRWLSIYAVDDGKETFSNTPSEWMHVAPETSGAMLLKILCPRS